MEINYSVNLSAELMCLLSQASQLKDEIIKQQSRANDNLRLVVQNKLRYLWTYNSNAIEGSTLSLGDTIFFLQQGLTVQGKPFKDFLDAKNHAHAIDYVLQWVQQQHGIDAHLIRSLNKLLLLGVETVSGLDAAGQPVDRPITAGNYKKVPNYVIQPDGSTHEYVSPFDVPQQVEDLCRWIESNPDHLPVIVVAALAHYHLVRIHPFDDGNGRGARVLMNIILMRDQFNPAVIQVSQRQAYLNSLKAADDGRLEDFVQFVTHSLIDTQHLVLEQFKNKS